MKVQQSARTYEFRSFFLSFFYLLTSEGISLIKKELQLNKSIFRTFLGAGMGQTMAYLLVYLTEKLANVRLLTYMMRGFIEQIFSLQMSSFFYERSKKMEVS